MDNTIAKINWAEVAHGGQVPAGMSLLTENTEFNVVQARTVTEGKSGIKRMRLTGIIQKADNFNENGRIYSRKILGEAVNAIQPMIKARKVLGEYDHPCLTTPDFRVLTTKGWKDFRDIKVGDYVYSRVNGVMVESRVNAVIDEPYRGDIYHFHGKYMDIEFTAPHKIIMDTRGDGKYISEQIESTAEEVYNNRSKYNKCKIPRTADWTGSDPDYYIIPGIPEDELKRDSINYYKNDITQDLKIDTQDFVSLLGIYLAEGFCGNDESRSYSIQICQKKDDYKQIIREMLDKLPIGYIENKNGWLITDMRLQRYFKKLGNKYQKYVPEDVKQLDGKYLHELVKWFQVGDGRRKHGCNNIFSTSKQLIDDLHECWIKTGGCGYKQTIITDKDYEFAGHIIEAKNKQPLYQLTLSVTGGIYADDRFLKIDKKHYEGNIYCLTTEHGNFYMEHNKRSFWTGNCDAKIHLDRVSHLMTKVWMEGKNVLGELEVLEEMPCGKMLGALIRANVTVGISSRGVGDMRPAMNESMQEAYEVLPGYRFVTWDTVAEPSVKEAELSVMESMQRRSQNRREVEQQIIEAIRNRFGS